MSKSKITYIKNEWSFIQLLYIYIYICIKIRENRIYFIFIVIDFNIGFTSKILKYLDFLDWIETRNDDKMPNPALWLTNILCAQRQLEKIVKKKMATGK